MSSFHFLRKEVPVRLANIMKEIDLLPSTLLSTPSMKLVRQWYTKKMWPLKTKETNSSGFSYVQSFRDVIRFRGAKRDDEAAAER